MSLNTAPWQSDDAYEQMVGTLFNYWACWTVYAVAHLSIADHLASGNLTAAEVARREGSAPHTTLRLMRAGAAVGLLTEDANERFGSTPLLETLRSDDPRSLTPFVLSQMASWLPWDRFVASIRDGVTRSTEAFGGSPFDFLAAHPEEAERFSAAMDGLTALWGPAIAKVIDTRGVRCAVDVGGANGALLMLLQRDNLDLRGIVFDRPNIAEYAHVDVTRSCFAERTTVVGGDFFESVPQGDLLLLKFILHDWSDDECIIILERCRQALAPAGRIAVIDSIVGPNNPRAALFDMNMLMGCTGRERTIDEFDELFGVAGLQRIAVRDTGTPQSVIELAVAEAE
jgi:O-methyltransferase domain/Dimerisation domain